MLKKANAIRLLMASAKRSANFAGAADLPTKAALLDLREAVLLLLEEVEGLTEDTKGQLENDHPTR